MLFENLLKKLGLIKETDVDNISSFDQCIDVCIKKRGSDIGKRAIKKLPNLAKTKTEWELVYSWSDDDKTKILAIEKLKELMTTIDWFKLYSENNRTCPANIAWEKLCESKGTIDEWLRISNTDHYLVSLSFKKITEIATTFDEWEFIYSHTDSKEISDFALKQMDGFIKTFDEWAEILTKTTKKEVERIALEKMLTSKTTFGKWAEICQKQNRQIDNFYWGQKALDKLSGLATTFDDWILILQIRDIYSTIYFKENIIERLSSLATTKEEWTKIFALAGHNDDIRKMALQKMK